MRRFPSYQIAKANDLQRRADVLALTNAVWQFTLENGGNYLGTLGSGESVTDQPICTGSGIVQCSGFIDIYPIVGDYIIAIPGDPQAASGFNSGYEVSRDVKGKITITAPHCEMQGCSITMTR